MKKRLLAVLLVLAILCPLLLIPAFADTTVYITKTGEKYHSAGCSSLSKSCYSISLSDAISKGYAPCAKCNPPTSSPVTKSDSPFTDISKSKYYYKPVLWAYNHEPQITAGMDKTHFKPDVTCTRGQIVTFLWRANGCPQPSAEKCSFKDVKSGAYYYTAVIWAVENGITNGIDKTHFAPDDGCTRGQVVTFLWRADNKPEPSTKKCPFKDVNSKSYYYSAVLWAVGENITTGMSATAFAPDAACSRGQIVSFLYRASSKAAPAPIETPEPDGSDFEIYFLDVGQGDSSLIECDGKYMLIDGGDKSNSSLIYSFLKSHNINHLDYIIASHPDADHIGGLSGALNYATVGKAFCTTTQRDTETFNDFVKYLSKQNVTITVPNAGDKYSLGNASFTILYPRRGNTLSNNTSLIIRIEYGKTSFLFTGDAETADEKALLESGCSVKSTVLKVAHHGSNSSTSYQFLYYVEPEYAVISVGNNSYGHPSDNVLSRLRDADVKTFRTDMQGDIHCVSDGSTVYFDVEKNTNVNTYSTS
ncbi:MAG: S-layer homology domain-containing protein [Clostridia bacterium]|nr:S-layer homology domain-containing protein [Clostridia bacterium]